MSMTFTKLFTSITESTLWLESANVRLVWITMLAMSDRSGRVWASIPGLANRARVPLEDCRAALEKFLAPDPDSRSKEHEGRRIVEIDGGWRLLNYEKYRAVRDVESIKEAKRRYINTKRASDREGVENVERCASGVDAVDQCRPNAEAEAEAEAEADAEAPQIQKEDTERKRTAPPAAGSEWIAKIYEAYPLKVNRPAAERAIAKALKKIEPSKLLELTEAFSVARPRGTPYTPHPATWFNGECYNDNQETWRPKDAPKPQHPYVARLAEEDLRDELHNLTLRLGSQEDLDNHPKEHARMKEIRGILKGMEQ